MRKKFVRVPKCWRNPPPPGHDFNKSDDPKPLRRELSRIRHEEWKKAAAGDGRGAAEAACIRLALIRGYKAALSDDEPPDA